MREPVSLYAMCIDRAAQQFFGEQRLPGSLSTFVQTGEIRMTSPIANDNNRSISLS